MSFDTRFILVIAATTCAIAATTPASAQSKCPYSDSIEIDNLTSIALAVWDQRWAERRQVTRAGQNAAIEAVPGRVQSLNISLAPEISLEGATETNEYIGAATIALEIGNLAEARRASIGAEWRLFEAELAAERWSYVDQIQNTYLTWRKHELERAHLESYLGEANAELEPIRQAQDRQLISQLDLADLEAEIGWIDAELSEAARRAKLARARLEALLGARCELGPVSANLEKPTRQNPWTPLVSLAESFPEIRAYEIRRQALQAQARAHEEADPTVFEVGIGARSIGLEETYIGPILAFTFPFQNTETSDAELARARAQSAGNAGQWASMRVRDEIRAEASNFDILLDEYFQLRERYVSPLEDRVKLMTRAFKASQVEIDRLIRSRRELHEAEHRLIVQRAEIDARHLKADAIRKLLNTSGIDGENL